jgi:hypothetical protein
MVREELRTGIVLYKGVFEDTQKIIESIEFGVKNNTVKWQPPYITNGVSDYVDKDIRDLNVLGIPDPKHSYEFFEENLMHSSNDKDIFEFMLGNTFKEKFDFYLKDYKMFYGIDDFKNYDHFQILKYGENNHFNNHVDDCLTFHRRISMSYYLNNDFDGGEIEFPRFNLKYKPEGNDLLIFPSSFIYNHSVHEVKNGTRYAIVNWVH